MRLPDRNRSYAVLIGTGTYTSPHLPDLPAVNDSLDGLVRVLTDETYGCFDRDNCRVLRDIGNPKAIGDRLVELPVDIDTLLVYFIGHGLAGTRKGDLYLALSETDPNRPWLSALAYDTLREILLDNSGARNRIVILDCCYSGRAVSTMGSAQETGLLDIEGVYILTSTAANRAALSPEGERHTAFSGELIRLLSQGDAEQAPLLTLDGIYRHLRRRLSARGLPRPWQSSSHNVADLALGRNRMLLGELSAEAPVPAAASIEPADPAIDTGEQAPSPGPARRRRRLWAATASAVAVVTAGTVAAMMSQQKNDPSTGGQTPATHTSTAPPCTTAVLDTGPLVSRIRGAHNQTITSIAVSEARRLLATSSGDKTIKLWNLDRRTPILLPQMAHEDPVANVTFNRDGSKVASASYDGTAVVWDTTTGQRLTTLDHRSGPSAGTDVLSVVFLADGTLATGDSVGWIRFWDPDTGSSAGPPLKAQAGEKVRDIVVSPDGTYLIDAGYRGTVEIWNSSTWRQIVLPAAKTGYLVDVDLSSDAKTIVAATQVNNNGWIQVWDRPSSRQTHTFVVGKDLAWAVAVSADGRTLAGTGANGTIQLWDLTTGRSKDSITTDGGNVNSAAFTASGTLISGGRDGQLTIVEPRPPRCP